MTELKRGKIREKQMLLSRIKAIVREINESCNGRIVIDVEEDERFFGKLIFYFFDVEVEVKLRRNTITLFEILREIKEDKERGLLEENKRQIEEFKDTGCFETNFVLIRNNLARFGILVDTVKAGGKGNTKIDASIRYKEKVAVIKNISCVVLKMILLFIYEMLNGTHCEERRVLTEQAKILHQKS